MEGQNFIKISIATSLGFDMTIKFENEDAETGKCAILMKSMIGHLQLLIDIYI